tara:strand:- start:1943 stop:2719 length:777 start_codon:yes stop_codon:yes gene_type:complete
MLSNPFKALKIGAETINENPVKYNKSRISRSIRTTYNLHIRGAYMPGQKEIFTTTSISKINQNSHLVNNQNMSSFRNANIHSCTYKTEHKDNIKINEFVPNDDEALLVAINELYRNIFGNLSLMESERPINIERRLRNGDITIREFTRKVCKSSIYKHFYFDSVSQSRSISLSYKHILGRPIKDRRELTQSSNILNKQGYEALIDWLIDSVEYKNIFGEDIVPHIRTWNSPIGITTKIFLETSHMTKSLASSDICGVI